MKQIITVLAILISGIASAQTELYTASICGGGALPRHVDLNGLDYVLTDDYAAIVARDHSDLVCLSSNGNINRNWRSYFLNYKGAQRIVDRTNFQHWRIEWGPDQNSGIQIQVRNQGSERFRVHRTRNNRIIINRFDNARDAWNYADRN